MSQPQTNLPNPQPNPDGNHLVPSQISSNVNEIQIGRVSPNYEEERLINRFNVHSDPPNLKEESLSNRIKKFEDWKRKLNISLAIITVLMTCAFGIGAMIYISQSPTKKSVDRISEILSEKSKICEKAIHSLMNEE